MSTARKLALATSMLADLAALLAELQVAAEQEETVSPDWVETTIAAERFGVPADSIRSLCRRKHFGRRLGSRWQVDLNRLRRHFGKT
ncbi:hypothetical protein NKI94_07040 [Mesorhizobium australicum]|uniref:hypothetical protein n=1 Tax=Mesorhizobium australicum TaxID=536018 RepID=UPI003334FB52